MNLKCEIPGWTGCWKLQSGNQFQCNKSQKKISMKYIAEIFKNKYIIL